MTSRTNLLKAFRLTHQYIGIFVTPAILFFALTGALQTFGLHETNRDRPNYKPAKWIVVLAQIHKKQVPTVPVRRAPTPSTPAQAPAANAGASAVQPGAADASPDQHSHRSHDDSATPTSSAAAAAAVAPPLGIKPSPPAVTPEPRRHNPVPLRAFFLLVCLGLFSSTTTGLYMSYKYVRNRTLVTATLIAGTVIPLLLLLP